MTRRPSLKGRGRLSSIELLPPEAAHIVAEAAQALADRDRTQTEIYADFVSACEELMAEHRGELEFGMPTTCPTCVRSSSSAVSHGCPRSVREPKA